MAKKLMILGTQSGSGKSTITTGILRILHKKGYRVSPFKSQNMALNSYITDDGLEIGRSQAVQAQACGKKPSVYMNPILLKPSARHKSQIISMGRPVGEMATLEYRGYRKQLVPVIEKALEHLENENDVIILEGAGSAYEVNLREGDISNMGMAEIADAPVILVADIDRGGVFASIAGTYWLMNESEKKRIKGVIVNKFRGKDGSFDDGVKDIERITGLPVIGVLPYFEFDIEGEDSLDLKKENNVKYDDDKINIVVVRLPYMSNFTDFQPLEQDENVNLIYSDRIDDIRKADLVIVPGTKSTIEDMLFLKESGIESALKKEAEKGKFIIGICGGFQILGDYIIDEDRVESNIGKIKGLSLLPVTTYFEKVKFTTQNTMSAGEFIKMNSMVSSRLFELFEGIEKFADEKMSSYEIHQGKSILNESMTGNVKNEERICDISDSGQKEIFNSSKDVRLISSSEGNVYGTYFHGIFDNDVLRNTMIENLKIKLEKNFDSDKDKCSYEEYKNIQFDKIAAHLEKYLNMDLIFKIINESEKR